MYYFGTYLSAEHVVLSALIPFYRENSSEEVAQNVFPSQKIKVGISIQE